jgi:hypothetical protein
MTKQGLCYEYPLRRDHSCTFMAQVVLPRDLTTNDAERLCAFIMTLAQPSLSPQPHEGETNG